MRKTLNPFNIRTRVSDAKSIGGARPIVQATSIALASGNVPMLAARIYAPGATMLYDDSDPRFEGKSDNVENIYLPAAVETQTPRSGIAQAINWLFTGRMA